MNRPRYTDALGERLLATVRDAYADADPVPPGLAERSGSALDLRALTIRQPWATWIALKAKLTENRTRPTKRRGPILIHAGLGFDEDAWQRPHGDLPPLRSLPAGAVIAVAEITDCHEADGCCGPWGEPGPGVFHYTLERVRRLPQPVPCKGALGFWRPPQDVLDAVLKQLGGAS